MNNIYFFIASNLKICWRRYDTIKRISYYTITFRQTFLRFKICIYDFTCVHLQTRVTGRKCGERNFHIFYQLLSGAEIPFLSNATNHVIMLNIVLKSFSIFIESLKLQRNAEKYVILKNSSVIDADRDNFNFTRVSHACLFLFANH